MVKKYIFLVFILVYICSKTCAQTSLNCTFSKNLITIEKNDLIANEIIIFKGKITEDNISNTTPILGKTIDSKKQLSFIPIVPLGWNQDYTLICGRDIQYFTLQIPDAYEFLSIKNIYPSSSSVPSNILKWYIKFSKAVNTSYIYKHIRFINASGDTISNAILPLENTLVSEDKTLITIWIEPGRQKRGLIPNSKQGAVFNPNKTYKLIISNQLKDSEGVPMSADYIHSFKVEYPDRIKPNITNWNIQRPEINSLSSLLIHTNESLDYGSILNNIYIINAQNQKTEGDWRLIQQEKTLSFIPIKPWTQGSYKVLFHAEIEDLAGNNLHKLFDKDIRKNNLQNTNTSHPEYQLDFVIQ